MSFDIVYILIVIGVILVSMTFHEAMHAFTSYWLGDPTAKLLGRLSLNPIKHIDPFLTILLPVLLAIAGAPIFGGAKPVPFNPLNLRYGEWGPAIVAISGPLSNLFIAFIVFGVYALVGVSSNDVINQIFNAFIYVNLGFFIFNMIPIPPLDGSRVIYALAPDFFRKLMEAFERYGIIIVFLIIFLAGPIFSEFILSSMKFFINIFIRIYGL